jgi:hypothetical protein
MANELVKQKVQSFWDTKEGTTGMFVGVGILGGLGYAAYKLMPYIANLMENTFFAIGFGLLSVALIWAFVIDGTLRNRMWLIYKLLMRALTYQIIKYDPVGVLRETQEVAAKRIEVIDSKRVEVNKSVMSLRNTVDKFTRQKDDLAARVRVLQRQGQPQDVVANEAMKIGRLDDALLRTNKALTMTKAFYDQLTKALKAVETIHSNIDFEIDISEEEYKAATASSNAWRAVRSAFKGSSETDALQADAFAFLAQDYTAKLGEIDSFMADSQKFIDSVDLQNAVYTDKGMRLLEDLNARDLDVLQTAQKVPLAAPRQAATDVSYTYFNKK